MARPRLLLLLGAIVLAISCGGAIVETGPTAGTAGEGGATDDATVGLDAPIGVTDASVTDAACGVGAGALCAGGQPCDSDADCASSVCSSITNACAFVSPPPSPGTFVSAIVAGKNHTCALWSDGIAKCWGSNAYGQLGLGDTIDRGKAPREMGAALPAVVVAPGRVISAIAAGGDHTCITYSTGQTDCFGRNTSGQLGIDNKSPVVVPGAVARWPDGALGSHNCTFVGRVNRSSPLAPDAGIRCWGDNSFGQLGAGDVVNRGDDPGEMATLPFIPFPAAGYTTLVFDPRGSSAQHTCVTWRGAPTKPPALHDLAWEAKIACWGRNDKGQLGLGDTAPRGDQPNEPPSLVDIGASFPGNYPGARLFVAAAGGSHTCAIVKQYATWGTPYLKCWGDNSRGQLGLGDTQSRGDDPGEMGDALPSVVGMPPSFDGKFAPVESPYLALGASHSCLLTSAVGPPGVVQCWGANESGQLGLGDAIDRGTAPGQMPPPVVELGTAKRAALYASGENHVCAVLQDVCGASASACPGTFATQIKCWGKNDQGQLGLGDTSNRGDEPGEMGDALPALNLR